MMPLKQLFILFFFFFALAQASAQLVEGTPCTASCLDPSKSTLTGRQPNQNNVSPNQNLPCGVGSSEDNPSWFIFRPSGTTVTFSIATSNCVAGSCGIAVEMALWEGYSCNSLTPIDCKVGTSATLTATVEPCKTYYLQIDGLCECQCNIVLTYDKNQILNEVPKPEIKGLKQVCRGTVNSFKVSMSSIIGCKPDAYLWTISPASAGTITKIFGKEDSVSIKISNPPATNKVTVCVEPKFNGKCLPQTNKECFELDIIDLKPSTCSIDLCSEERPLVYDLIKCVKTTNPTWGDSIKPVSYIINLPPGTKKTVTIPIIEQQSGCASSVLLDVHVFDNKPVQLAPLMLCEGEKDTIKGIEFTCADAGNAPKKFIQEGFPKPMRCDTSFEMLVNCLKIKPVIAGNTVLGCSSTPITLNALGAGAFTLPNNIKLTTYEGEGKRAFAWYKNGALLPNETQATLAVTEPGLYDVVLTYTYEITLTLNGKLGTWSKSCSKATGVQVTKDLTIPLATASCNTPLCSGSSLQLLASGGATYDWSGPDNFKSTLQNPIITAVEAKNAGTYTVVVSNANSCTKSANTTLEVKNCIATNDIKNESNIVLAPNPMQEILHISADKRIQKVEISNVIGQILLSQKNDTQNVTLNTSALLDGVYFTKVYLSEKEFQIFKIIKE